MSYQRKIEQTFNGGGGGGAHINWLVMRNAQLSLLNNIKDLNCDRVRKFVMLSI